MTEYRFPYLEPRQSVTHEPTQWQMDLASAIESIFAKGDHSLDELIDGLNKSRVRPLNGGQWTAKYFTELMRELGA